MQRVSVLPRWAIAITHCRSLLVNVYPFGYFVNIATADSTQSFDYCKTLPTCSGYVSLVLTRAKCPLVVDRLDLH